MKNRNILKSGKEVIVIDPSLLSPEVDSFNRLQKVSQIPLTYHLPSFHDKQSYVRTPVDLIAGVIIFGSAASVNDTRLWQSQLVNWIQKVILPHKIPIFGICYGHQLLHQILGGRVDYVKSDRQKIEGIRLVELNGEAGLNLECLTGKVVFSHCEHVVQSGDGFKNWAQDETVFHEASFHNNLPIWTMQTHPEATQVFYENLGFDYQLHQSSFGWSILDAFLNKL